MTLTDSWGENATLTDGTRVRLGFDGQGVDVLSRQPVGLQSSMPVVALLRDGPVAVVRFDTPGPAAAAAG